MSETLPNDVICPGQRNLLGEGTNYLRAMFMIYWDGSNTSAQPFYLHEHRFELSLTGIAALEAEVLTQLHLFSQGTPVNAVYLGYEGITLTDDDVKSVSWRLLTSP